MPGRKTYNQIWPVLPSSGAIFFEVSASQVSDVIAFCPVLLPSTVSTFLNVCSKKKNLHCPRTCAFRSVSGN